MFLFKFWKNAQVRINWTVKYTQRVAFFQQVNMCIVMFCVGARMPAKSGDWGDINN